MWVEDGVDPLHPPQACVGPVALCGYRKWDQETHASTGSLPVPGLHGTN